MKMAFVKDRCMMRDSPGKAMLALVAEVVCPSRECFSPGKATSEDSTGENYFRSKAG
jgi:hypothetical protein